MNHDDEPLPTGPRAGRVRVAGKFFCVNDQKVYLRGVTYGTFRPRQDGSAYPEPLRVAQDFAGMVAAGVNCVRTYTPAPAWFLDMAYEHDLWVMAGLPWEQHVTGFDEREAARSIESRVRAAVRQMAGHPALLAYSVGNEVPAGIARWHGRRRTERFIERLYHAVKDEDPGTLVTYVNFPTTEYLQLPFVDFLSFNVYLEKQPALERYLARLHNIADERPLVMAEIGLDSRRNGKKAQAESLAWQVETTYRSGCAGAFAYAWTDEWHRGGHDIEDWDFGLVDRFRRPKPALASVTDAFARLHHAPDEECPRITVAVCTHNGERWLPGCLDALAHVDYPDFEVLVVSDGSTDRTDELALAAGVRLVSHPENLGLSAARNTALLAATGDVIAYLDDDARPDPDWLRYLGLAFSGTDHVAVGGPNIAPPNGNLVADAIANAPGGPVQVLVDDEIAEHVPGCNLAVRVEALRTIGGFDERFRIAGDDVDVCWRLQADGGTIGFSPGAMVWHHRRESVRSYLRQQWLYGRAEGMLERKWPERYNRLGHLTWAGRIYGAGARMSRGSPRSSVRYGKWGSGLFQSIYQPAPRMLSSLALMPEWYLLLGVLLACSLLGALWSPLLVVAGPLLGIAVVSVLALAWSAAGHRNDEVQRKASRSGRLRLRLITAGLHVTQPLVRLVGRLQEGLRPWRRRCRRRFAAPRPVVADIWSEHWRDPGYWLRRLDGRLRMECGVVAHGSEFDRWDLEIRGGSLGVARLLTAVEEHGGGRQLLRVRMWPAPSRMAFGGIALLSVLAAGAVADGAGSAAVVLAGVALAVLVAAVYDCVLAIGAMRHAVGEFSAYVAEKNQQVPDAPEPVITTPTTVRWERLRDRSKEVV